MHHGVRNLPIDCSAVSTWRMSGKISVAGRAVILKLFKRSAPRSPSRFRTPGIWDVRPRLHNGDYLDLTGPNMRQLSEPGPKTQGWPCRHGGPFNIPYWTCGLPLATKLSSRCLVVFGPRGVHDAVDFGTRELRELDLSVARSFQTQFQSSYARGECSPGRVMRTPLTVLSANSR